MTRVSGRAWLLVLGVALAAAAPSLRNGFVYDDVPIIVEDARVHEGPLTRQLKEQYWPSTFGDDALYRPVTSLTYALDWRSSGGKPFAFHLVNVALHVGVVALVLVLGSLVLPPAGAIVAGLWFAVQPVHVEAFANVVGRAELLAAFFYLLAVIAYAAAGAAGRGRASGAALAGVVLVTAFLADGAKEHAITLPAALLAIDWVLARRDGEPPAARWRRAWFAWFMAVAAAALFLLARSSVVVSGAGHGQIAAGLENLGVPGRFVAMLPGYATWARLMLVPAALSADYSPNALSLGGFGPLHAAGLAVVLGVCGLAWTARRRLPAVSFGIAWFVATASVVANIVVPTGVVVAERTLYLPSAGVAIALGAAWLLLPARRWLWPATALALALLAARALERETLWRDDTKFFERLTDDAPASYRSWWMRGTWEFRAGHFAAGERLYRHAIAIYPNDASLIGELGLWYANAGAWEPADRFLSRGLQMDPEALDLAVKAIYVRNQAGHAAAAAQLANWSVNKWPDRVDVLLVAIRAFQLVGNDHEAERAGLHMAALAPARWQLLQIAGDAAARAGDCVRARAFIAEAGRRAPATEAAPRNLLARVGTGADCAARIK